MKRNFTKILAAFALLVGLTIPMGMWGQNSHTIGWGAATGDEGTYTNFTSTSGSVQGILSFSTAKNSSQNAPAYNANSSELRLYYASNGQGGSITIVPVSGVTITEAVMTTSTTPSVAYSVDGGTAVYVSATNNNTYTISDISVTQSLMIQNVNTTNTQLRISTIALTYTTGGAAVTYTVTYDCNGGTSDCPDDLTDVEAGSSISLASAPIRSGYTFNGWSDGDNTYQAGDAYTVNGDVTFTAQWVEDGVLVFDLSSNPGGWPTDNPTTLTEYTYTLNNVSYTFALKNVKCNSGYLMMTSVAVLGLPAIEGYKLTKVVAYNSNSCSTSTKVGISSSASEASYIEGGAIQTWSNTGSQYTYNLTSTVANTMYYMYVTNKNAQLLSLALKYELDNDPAVATSVTIDASGITNTNVFESTAAGSLSATVKDNENNPINGAVVTWTSSNEEVATIAADGTVTLVAAGTTTITAAYAGVENQYRPSQGTYELTVTNEDPNAPGTLNNPYTVAQARAAIDAGSGTQGVYATGIVCTASSNLYNNKYLSYYISADGSTESDQLEAYNGLGIDGANFTSVDDVQVGDIVVIYGNLTKFNTTYEFAANNQLVSLERPQSTEPSITLSSYEINATADATEGTIVATYANIPEGCTIYPIFYESDGETPAEYDWITVTINSDNNVAYTIAANTGEARTAYFRVHVADEIGEVNVNSELVTVSQEAYVAPITSGKGTITFGKGNDVEIDNETVTGKDNLNNTWTITTVGTTSFTNNNGTGYSQVGSSNKPATSITFATTLPNEAVISGFEAKFGGFGSTAGTITLKVGEATVGTGSLNETNDVVVSSLPMVTGTVLTVTVTDIAKGVKCYYISYTLGAESYTLNITGYASDDTKDGYYLIASPVSVNPATVAGMTEGDFDLYSYDDTEELEWRNYETSAFNLEPGKGYLYAKKATTETPNYEFTLTGAPYAGQPIQLIQGWNLVGNPYGQTAYITNEYYMMNPEGSDLVPGEGNAINAMQGIFVNATEAGTITFSTENNGKAVEQVVMNLTRNRGTAIDRAIVRFDEGQQLPKFQLNPENTKLYIAQGDKDYAIVRSAAQGEMPVSFRASENGTYTIAVEAENVDMNYLHLIDNMTGADVDLLATPNYTFEARTNDYTSRFRLVFSANGIDEQTAETFAFFNGTNWTVSNTGDATLQVIDITGRIVSSETINGNATVSLNQPAGIYMLRLVSGNDVKVQKVVVR